MDQMSDQYPRETRLPDGEAVEVRLMTGDDRDAVLNFARGLPEDDLLFLRPIALELAAQIVDDDSSRLEASVQIAPGQDDAYQLSAEVRGGGMQAQISAGNDGTGAVRAIRRIGNG